VVWSPPAALRAAAAPAAEALGYPVVVKLAADGVVSAGLKAGADVQGTLVQPQRTGGIDRSCAIPR